MRIILTNSAEEKLTSIYRYLSEQASEEIARKHVVDIENEILARLDTFPKIGVVYRNELSRKLVIKVGTASYYTVLYEINEVKNFISVYQIYGKGEDW